MLLRLESICSENLGITLGGNYGIDQSKTHEENTFKILDPNITWELTSRDEKMHDRTDSYMYFAAIDYSFNDSHWARLSYRRRPASDRIRFAGELSLFDAMGREGEGFESEVDGKRADDNINLFYTGALGKRWRIELSSDWYHKGSDTRQIQKEEARITDILSKANSNLWGISPRATYKVDRSLLEIGVDWSKSTVRSTIDLNVADISSSDIKIDETKRAVYAGYNWSSSNQLWALSLGLRYEDVTRWHHDYRANETSAKQAYRALLPSFSLSYRHGRWMHALNYNSSTSYPSFSQIAGGTSYLNRFNYKTSNPKLEQSVSHNIGYSLIYKWIYLTASYTYTQNPFFETYYVESFQSTYRIRATTENIDRMHGVKVLANIAPKFGVYEPRLTLGYIQDFMSVPKYDDGVKSTVTKPYALVSLSNGFSLPQDWRLSLDLLYRGASTIGYIQASRVASVDFSVQKSFLQKSLQFTLKASDIFNTSTPRISAEFMGVGVNGFAWMDRRSIRLDIVWRFNQHKKRNVRSSLSTEVDRL